MQETASSLEPKLPSGLLARRDGPGCVRLCFHIALLVGLATLMMAASSAWMAGIWVVAYGVVLSFLFCPLHECIHGTAFKSPSLNRVAAHLCGLLLVLPPRYFRCFHFEHHRYTQDIHRDPELAAPKPRTLLQYVLYLSGISYWRERLSTTLRHALGGAVDRYVPYDERVAIEREAKVYVLAYLGIFLSSGLALSTVVWTFWVLPAILGQPMLRFYLLAEHTGCDTSSNMLQNSRTLYTLWPLEWLAWNMPFHAEHHRYPAIPFHRLPLAHQALRAHVRFKGEGYAAFHRALVGKLMNH